MNAARMRTCASGKPSMEQLRTRSSDRLACLPVRERTTTCRFLSRGRENRLPSCAVVLEPTIHASICRSWHGLVSGLPLGKDPVGTRKVTGVAFRMELQIVLVLRLGFPEVPDRRHLGDDLARP